MRRTQIMMMQALRQLPKNWPANVHFMNNAKCDLVEIKLIIDERHPAKGQHGLFAATDIESGVHLFDYIGEVVTHANDPSYLYYLYSKENHTYYMNAKYKGNESRFINDAHGIHDQHPNVIFNKIRASDISVSAINVVTARKILKGEEILTSYGDVFWDIRQ
jgi:hypothetical protein